MTGSEEVDRASAGAASAAVGVNAAAVRQMRAAAGRQLELRTSWRATACMAVRCGRWVKDERERLLFRDPLLLLLRGWFVGAARVGSGRSGAGWRRPVGSAGPCVGASGSAERRRLEAGFMHVGRCRRTNRPTAQRAATRRDTPTQCAHQHTSRDETFRVPPQTGSLVMSRPRDSQSPTKSWSRQVREEAPRRTASGGRGDQQQQPAAHALA